MNRSIYMMLATALALFTANAYAIPYAINSDTGDALLASVTTQGSGPDPVGTKFFPQGTTGPTLVMGRAGSNPTWNGNGIMFFQLPADVSTVNTASLSVVFDLVDSTSTTQGVDLWGLGFQGGTTVDTSWFSTTELDAGAGVGIPSRVKVQDDLIVGTNSLGTYTANGPALVSYLQSLYDAGAEGGDFAIFRLNVDFNAGVSSNSRFRSFSGDASVLADRPLLQMEYTEVVPIPEPSTGILIPGVLVFFGLRRKTKRNSNPGIGGYA